MTPHRIQAIQFLPRSNHGSMSCSCGWQGSSLMFDDHRRDVGALRGNAGHIVATADSPAFMKRLCPHGHGGQWRPRSDGRRECGECSRVRDRDRKAAVA